VGGKYIAPLSGGPAANNNNNSWGVANTGTGSAAAGGLSGSIYSPGMVGSPEPGTVVIRLNGRVEVDATVAFSNANSLGGYKINPINMGSWMRLYPGFDGKSSNGLRYGAAVELRENFGTGLTTSGNGPAAAGSTTAPSASGFTSSETVLVRRAFSYLASDNVGLLRLGQGDGVMGLFDNCVFTTQCWDAGVGNFNGGQMQGVGAGAPDSIPFVWLSQAGAEYGNTKAVYLSPQFYGLDFGVQYAPNMGNSFAGGCNAASAACIGLTSGNDATRWYNQVAVGVRYQHSFGAVDLKAYGLYETAGKENLTVGATPASIRYDNLNFYKAGMAVTAMNTTLAVDYIGGAVNGQLSMRPVGGANTNAVLAGVTYKNGPLTLGAEMGTIDTQGDARLVHVSQRHEYEIAFGGNYAVAPGLNLVGEYMYTHRHQGNFNFVTNAVGSTGDTQGQGILFATVLSW
jgi:hypothetical protein